MLSSTPSRKTFDFGRTIRPANCLVQWPSPSSSVWDTKQTSFQSVTLLLFCIVCVFKGTFFEKDMHTLIEIHLRASLMSSMF